MNQSKFITKKSLMNIKISVDIGENISYSHINTNHKGTNMTHIYSVESPDLYLHFETRKDAVSFAHKTFKGQKEEGIRENIWVTVEKKTVAKMPIKSLFIAMLDGSGCFSESETILELRG
jgi:hypothetical protein